MTVTHTFSEGGMVSVFGSLVVLLGSQDLAAYEGVARDDFAVWSFTSGSVVRNGDSRTTSVLIRYVTPLSIAGGSASVAYSIHDIRFNCDQRNSDWSSGMNYAANGTEIGPGTASTAEPWSGNTSGYVELATQVCALDGSL
jgi:hypothetical protein